MEFPKGCGHLQKYIKVHQNEAKSLKYSLGSRLLGLNNLKKEIWQKLSLLYYPSHTLEKLESRQVS